MKHRFLTLISSLLLLTACSDSFLERAPEGNYVDVTYYTSDDALEQATAPLYNRAWFDLNSRAIVPLGSNRANDNFSRWGAPEFTNFKVTALSENLANAWTGFYSVITMANAVISDVQTKCSNSVSERAKRTAIAEARLMRACAYFYMVRLWGPVIIIEDNDKVVANPMQPLHREEDVLELVIRDLTYAVENLPEVVTAKGRVNAWGAKGMLAKVYLARSGWKGGTRDNADLEKAKELAASISGSFIPEQFDNPANPAAHKATTGPEIYEDTDGAVDIFVAGVGTGGTLTGVGEYLKEKKPSVKVVAVEPADSPLLSQGKPGPHKIQGIGTNFLPKTLNTKIYDEILTASTDQAYETARDFIHHEGFLIGISGGAALYAAVEVAKRPENKGKTLVVLLPDNGDRYLTTPGFLKKED